MSDVISQSIDLVLASVPVLDPSNPYAIPVLFGKMSLAHSRGERSLGAHIIKDGGWEAFNRAKGFLQHFGVVQESGDIDISCTGLHPDNVVGPPISIHLNTGASIEWLFLLGSTMNLRDEQQNTAGKLRIIETLAMFESRTLPDGVTEPFQTQFVTADHNDVVIHDHSQPHAVRLPKGIRESHIAYV